MNQSQFVRYQYGRESTVSLKDLASCPPFVIDSKAPSPWDENIPNII